MSPRMSSPWHLHVTSIGDAVQDISRMQVNANLFKSVQMFVVFLAFSTNAQTQLQLKSRKNMHGPHPMGLDYHRAKHAWAKPHAYRACMGQSSCMGNHDCCTVHARLNMASQFGDQHVFSCGLLSLSWIAVCTSVYSFSWISWKGAFVHRQQISAPSDMLGKPRLSQDSPP